MTNTTRLHHERDRLTSYYVSGDFIRSRSVSEVVLSGTLHVPAPPTRLVADWDRDISQHLGLESGDVDELSLARARARWPEYKHCVQTVADWMHAHGLPEVLVSSDVTLMVCRGAKYHHDGERYGGMAFCNLFLSEDRGLDLHFPHTAHRIPLVRGTVVVFDACQPHAVIERASRGFTLVDFPHDRDCTQVFLSWELPIENWNVGKLLRVEFDIDPSPWHLPANEQVWRNGVKVALCAESGRFL